MIQYPLTLVVITKNSGKSLAACLSSASWIPNIIVVDSGSTDNTISIAERYGATVIHQDWLGFGPQKQFAVNHAPTDWVLCLDSDEFLSEELTQSLKKLFSDSSKLLSYNSYRFTRTNKFMGRFLRHGEGYPDWNLRLFNRQAAQWSRDTVHEKVISTDNRKPLQIGSLSGTLFHEPEETIFQYLKKQNNYTDLQVSLLSDHQPISAWQAFLSPTSRFVKYYFLKLGFLDGLPGFTHILIGCFFAFIKYIKAIEAQRKKSSV